MGTGFLSITEADATRGKIRLHLRGSGERADGQTPRIEGEEMTILKPAHEVLVEQIKKHMANLKRLDGLLNRGAGEGGVSTSIEEVIEQKMFEAGGLASQMDSLGTTIIPKKHLAWVVSQLRELKGQYMMLDQAVEELSKRQPEYPAEIEGRTTAYGI